MKVLFQQPLINRKITYGKFEAGAGNNTFPCGIASIAQYLLDRNYEVTYLEPSIEGMTLEDYKTYLRDNKFEIICMSSTTLEIGKVIETFEIIKKINPKIITVLGGIHATIMPLETLNETSSIDYLILGEGEKPVANLLNCIKTNKLENIRNICGIAFRAENRTIMNPPNFGDMLSPDEIPAPAYNLFPMKKYEAQLTFTKRYPSYTIIASRGCPFKCAFCNASDIFGRTVRYKKVDRVIEEIKTLKDLYNAKGIFFLDSTFTINRKWIEEFCTKYIESKIGLPWACNSRVDTVDEYILKLMKKAGCWEIMYGIESGNQKSLDIIDKKTTVEKNTEILNLTMKLGFYTYVCYIICLPGETEKDALNTIKYAKKMSTHLAMFYLPIPFPKTKLWYTCKEMGILRENAKWEDYNAWDWNNPVYINPLIGKDKMKKLLKYAYFSYYSTPKVIMRNLKELMFLKQDVKKYILGIKALYGLK